MTAQVLIARAGDHDGPVQQEFFRPAGDALGWVDELPEWSLLSSWAT